MRCKLFYLLALVLFNNCLSAQSCLPDGIIFSTQEEIDNFALDYAGCTQILGDVVLGSDIFPNEIKDLSGLNTLRSIGGKLTIENNDSLQNLIGLDNLHTINGGLAIQFNYLLNSLYGLRNLSALGENLVISVNDSLPNLTGLEGLSVVEADIIIDNNDGLISLSGLDNLNEIGGNCYIKYNDKLLSLQGFGELIAIQESFHLWYNLELNDMTALNNLNEISMLSIIGNYNLPNLVGFEGIATIDEHLEIKYNTDLSDFSGLNNLTTIGGHLQIHANAITSFDGFHDLNTVGEYIAVSENPNLANFNGLDNLTTIGEYLFVGKNPTLLSFVGSQNLLNLNGYLWVSNNPLLDNIESFAEIDHIGMSDLRIYQNPNLDFCSTESVCGYLIHNDLPPTIYNNSTNCNNTEIVSAGCNLPIELLAFKAYLENMRTILIWETATEVNNRGFEVEKSKDAVNWQKIAWVDGAGNSTISMTYQHIDEQPFQATSYYRLKQIDFDGEFEYSDIVSVYLFSENTTIYPNPVKDILYVDIGDHTIQNIEVYDYTGKIILQDTYTDNIRVETLPAGIYAVKIMTSSGTFNTKFIKQSS